MGVLCLSAGLAWAAEPEAVDAPADAPDPQAAPDESLQTVAKEVEGTVEYRTGAEQPWQALDVGQALAEGFDVRTGFRARAVLESRDSLVQVDPLTVVRIGELRRDGNTVRTRLYLKQGSTQSIVERGEAASDFAIVTPSATLSVQGTKGVRCSHRPDTGGRFGITGPGRIGVQNHTLGKRTTLVTGQFTNPKIQQAVQHLASQRRSNVPTTAGFTGQETVASTRRNVTLPLPPVGSAPLPAAKNQPGQTPPAPADQTQPSGGGGSSGNQNRTKTEILHDYRY